MTEVVVSWPNDVVRNRNFDLTQWHGFCYRTPMRHLAAGVNSSASSSSCGNSTMFVPYMMGVTKERHEQSHRLRK